MDKYVTQEECEARRKELNEEISSIRRDMSEMVGIDRAQTEQINNTQNTLKWLAGIAGTTIAAILLLIIKGALKI